MRSAPDLKKLHSNDAEIIIVNSIQMLFNPPVRNRNLLLSSDGNLADPPEMVRSQQIDGGWGCMLLVRYRFRISGKCHRSGAGSVADQHIRMLSYPPE
jgi:hypothetical protein